MGTGSMGLGFIAAVVFAFVIGLAYGHADQVPAVGIVPIAPCTTVVDPEDWQDLCASWVDDDGKVVVGPLWAK